MDQKENGPLSGPEKSTDIIISQSEDAVNIEECGTAAPPSVEPATEMLTWALKYHAMGFSVIPITPATKKPACKWKSYQSVMASREQIVEWFGNSSCESYNIGIVTGPISGIDVIDFDSIEAYDKFRNDYPDIETPTVKSGKGYHLYLKHKPGTKNTQNNEKIKGIDIRGEGGYIIAPPSIHISGNVYRWLEGHNPNELPLAEWPERFYDLAFETPNSQKLCSAIDEGVEFGERNQSLASIAGSWIRAGHTVEECVGKAVAWNLMNKPPMEEAEVRTTVESIFRTHNRNVTDDMFKIESLINFSTVRNYIPTLKAIATVDDTVARGHYIKKLAKKLDIDSKTLFKELDRIKDGEPGAMVVSESDNIILTHPSYDVPVKGDFMNLGFREKVLSDGKLAERNIYVVADSKGKVEIYGRSIIESVSPKIVFDDKNRTLIDVNERWNKGKIIEFAKNPEVPVGLYLEIKSILRQYIEFQDEAYYGIVSAWIIGTYFYRCFHAFVFLLFMGKKQCGKSRCLDLISNLALNAVKTKDISVAALSDTIDGIRGTLLIDQAENLCNRNNNMVGLVGHLADSYTIGGGKRRVMDMSNGRKVLEFEAYGPKVFGTTDDIDPDLKDRCVFIPMIRSSREFPYPDQHLPIWSQTRDKLYRLALLKHVAVREIYSTAGCQATMRVRELWRAIDTVLILENVNGTERCQIYDAFMRSMQETQAEMPEFDISVFEAILNMLEKTGDGNGIYSVSEISDFIYGDFGFEGSRKKFDTQVGKVINQYNLSNESAKRKNGKRAYRFSVEHVIDIYNRYRPFEPRRLRTTASGSDEGTIISTDVDLSGISGQDEPEIE